MTPTVNDLFLQKLLDRGCTVLPAGTWRISRTLRVPAEPHSTPGLSQIRSGS